VSNSSVTRVPLRVPVFAPVDAPVLEADSERRKLRFESYRSNYPPQAKTNLREEQRTMVRT
jgi:hypothetical protein